MADDAAVHFMDTVRDPDVAGADGLGGGDERAALTQEGADLSFERTLLARVAAMLEGIAIAERSAALAGTVGGI
jgi:hypothetical protein